MDVFLPCCQDKNTFKKNGAKKSKSAPFGRMVGWTFLPANFTTRSFQFPNGHGAVRVSLPKAGLHERMDVHGRQFSSAGWLYFRNPIPKQPPVWDGHKTLVNNGDNLRINLNWLDAGFLNHH